MKTKNKKSAPVLFLVRRLDHNLKVKGAGAAESGDGDGQGDEGGNCGVCKTSIIIIWSAKGPLPTRGAPGTMEASQYLNGLMFVDVPFPTFDIP